MHTLRNHYPMRTSAVSPLLPSTSSSVCLPHTLYDHHYYHHDGLTTDDSPYFSQTQSTARSPLAACPCGSLLSFTPSLFLLVLSQCPLLFSVSHRETIVCAVCKSNLLRVIRIAICGQSIGGRYSRESCLHPCLLPKALVGGSDLAARLAGVDNMALAHSLTNCGLQSVRS